MNDEEIRRTLGTLLYADRMAVVIYGECQGIADEENWESLSSFRDDHQRRVDRIQSLCDYEGWEPIDASEDLKALVNEAHKVIRATRGQGAMLEALLLSERANAALYDAAEQQQLPGEVADTIADHHSEERLHVSYIEQHVPELVTVSIGAAESEQHPVACMTGGLTDDINPDDFD